MTRTIAETLTLGLLLACLCAGCGGKFTRQRYETVYAAMPDRRVRQVLGEPNATSTDRWSYVHHMPYYRATVLFKDGKVVDKSWSVEKPRTQPK